MPGGGELRSYDDIPSEEQAAAHAEIDKRMEETRESLDLEAEFLARGITSWVSTDEHGNVEMQGPDQEGWRPALPSRDKLRRLAPPAVGLTL